MYRDNEKLKPTDSGPNKKRARPSEPVRMLTEQELEELKRETKADSEWMKAELERLEPRILPQGKDGL